MNVNEIIRNYALEHVGCPYVYGATAAKCTPSYRKARIEQYPITQRQSRNTPGSVRQTGKLPGCKYEGNRLDCPATRYAVRSGFELPSGSKSQFTKVVCRSKMPSTNYSPVRWLCIE